MMFPSPTPRQARIMMLALTGFAFAVLAGLLAALVWAVGRVLQILSPVLWPLAAAGVIAYLLDPVVDFIERKGASRARAILAVFALAALITLALVSSVVPQVVRETKQLADKFPVYSVN